MIVTRFAPSPTGLLHLGHAYAAITAHESGDDFLLRIEDIDKGRSRDKFIQSIFYDLKWLGLSWDEPSLRQSTRIGAYAEQALAAGLISIHFVNVAGSVLVAPFGGTERRFSTAPFSVGVPTDPPVVVRAGASRG